jgi:hypothetical protein
MNPTGPKMQHLMKESIVFKIADVRVDYTCLSYVVFSCFLKSVNTDFN